MALDGIFLSHIAKEIKDQALGGRITQIHQPNRDEIIMAIRTMEGTRKILLSARANSPRVSFTRFAPENPPVPPMLCMLLRKKLGSGKLVDVRQPELERILFLDFEAVNELGDKVKITVAAEIMGKYSNVIIIDEEGIIIDSLKRVDMTVSSQRLVLPGLRYELPPPQDKLNILSSEAEKICERIKENYSGGAVSKAVIASIQGISPVVSREIEYRAFGDFFSGSLYEEKNFQSLVNAVEDLKNTAENVSGEPYILIKEGNNAFDFSFMCPKQYGDAVEIKKCQSFGELLDTYYSTRDSAERMKVKSKDLHRLLVNITERLSKKINLQKAQLQQCENREELRIKGDLLQANLYRIERGANSVTVENFYDPEMKPITIELDPALSPSVNAQRYYRDYRKAKTAEKYLKEYIEKAMEELEYIDAVSDELARAESERELSQIRLELSEQGYIKEPKGKRKPPAALPPLEYKSSDGYKILVGRNNKQNDQLTLKQANNNDMWLHTKDIHGSHVIIESDGEEIPDRTLVEAANLAAYHSKARESSKVPVDYTRVRYVKKPAGAKPGMVIYVNNKTLYVEPKSKIGEDEK